MGFKHINSLEMKELEIPRIVADTALEAAENEGGFEVIPLRRKDRTIYIITDEEGSLRAVADIPDTNEGDVTIYTDRAFEEFLLEY